MNWQGCLRRFRTVGVSQCQPEKLKDRRGLKGMRNSSDHGVGFGEKRIEREPRGDEGKAKEEQEGREGSEY